MFFPLRRFGILPSLGMLVVLLSQSTTGVLSMFRSKPTDYSRGWSSAWQLFQSPDGYYIGHCFSQTLKGSFHLKSHDLPTCHGKWTGRRGSFNERIRWCPLPFFRAERGEALYLPAGWWHAVVGSQEPNMAIVFGYAAGTEKQIGSKKDPRCSKIEKNAL